MVRFFSVMSGLAAILLAIQEKPEIAYLSMAFGFLIAVLDIAETLARR